MPRRERTQEVVIRRSATGNLVSAAARLSGPGGKPKKFKKAPAWNTQAWMFYDSIGEFRYACNWVGNVLSRVTLGVHYEGKETGNADAKAVLGALFGGVDGQREMLRQLGIHFTVAGDAYLVGEDMGDSPDRWRVIAATRLKQVPGSDPNNPSWKLGDKELDDPMVIRVWRPHPENETKADSPTKAVLGVLAELDGYGKDARSQLSSRLARAGILALPDGMTFGSVRSANNEDDEAGALASGVNANVDAFLIELMETIMEAIADPDSPAAQTPILLQAPGEFLDKIKHITFWTPFDDATSGLRDSAIRRLALGMDMPPEVLTGSGELNHWNAWQIEEASIKSHTEPLLQIITSSLNEQYLWAGLEGMGMDPEEARKYTIVADTSQVRLRPNRSKEAQELYERGELSARTMLIENGFDPEVDGMTEEERTAWLTKKVASGSTTPELVAYALQLLGVRIPTSLIQVQERGTEAPSSPSLAEHPDRPIPDVTEGDVARGEIAVFRALERVGARLRTKYKDSVVPGSESVATPKLYRYAHVNEGMLDDLLFGAWDIVDEMGINISPVKLDAYVRHLLVTSEPFTPQSYRRYMEAR